MSMTARGRQHPSRSTGASAERRLDVPRGARPVADVWQQLTAAHDGVDVFSAGMTHGLPEPAQRWVRHSLAEGTALRPAAVIEMHGHIRLGTWRRFRARQALAPGRGYLWSATASFNGLPVIGYDRYSGGSAQMRWRLLGLAPVVRADGPDVARSAAGRLAAECVVVPSSFRQAAWQTGGDPDSAQATWWLDGEPETVELHVGPAGQLRSVVMQRWGNPCGEPFGRYPFGVALSDEATFAGVTIPTVLTAGWFFGTPRWDEGEFFRARITSVTWR